MKRVVLILTLLALAGCNSWWNKDEDDGLGLYKGIEAKQLYAEADKAITAKQYSSAAKRLEALESMYPFSPYSERAQRLLIYAYYQNGEYPAASAEADHYIHLYPRSEHVDYAYYMKALANFQQPRSALGHLLSVDESWRDPGTQLQAYTDFLVFIEKFPKSVYYQNALHRLIYLRNEFAQHELNNGKYYFDRDMYVAAAARANYVVQTYPQAPAVHDALVVMYRSYKQLGLKKAMEEAAVVYQATYHESIEAAKLDVAP
ncbi:MAG: outer membrane protein assembly factor BamD [Gammaproteobacteria bacterium]|nr:outer membrane protein assembly factor BamD [Gammaproteobacteria bacterium]